MVKIGILGGGPIAKMTALAASALNIETVIFAPEADCPAARVTPHTIVGEWRDEILLKRFAAMCDVVTLETEHVALDIVQKIENWGTPVYPTSKTLAQVQDKLTQFRTMQSAGLDVPRFRPVQTATDVLAAVEETGFPLLLKTRQSSNDGRGNVVIYRSADIPAALEKLRGYNLLAQEFVEFVRELAVIVVRGHGGEMQFYPVVETIQQHHICHTVLCPAGIDETTAYKATEMAKHAVETIDGVGVFGVEMFEIAGNEVRYNEIAPHPHHAGHFTIEGTITSQFANHIRAIMGFPRGDVYQIAPAAAMINILADRSGTLKLEAFRDTLATGGAQFHLYSGNMSPGQKIGHVTVLGYTTDGAEKVARLALSRIHW